MKKQYANMYKQLGLTIQFYRKSKNLTQEQLAELVGIERTHMGFIEQARAGASLDVIFAIAEKLEVPVHKLFSFKI